MESRERLTVKTPQQKLEKAQRRCEYWARKIPELTSAGVTALDIKTFSKTSSSTATLERDILPFLVDILKDNFLKVSNLLFSALAE